MKIYVCNCHCFWKIVAMAIYVCNCQGKTWQYMCAIVTSFQKIVTMAIHIYLQLSHPFRESSQSQYIKLCTIVTCFQRIVTMAIYIYIMCNCHILSENSHNGNICLYLSNAFRESPQWQAEVIWLMELLLESSSSASSSTLLNRLQTDPTSWSSWPTTWGGMTWRSETAKCTRPTSTRWLRKESAWTTPTCCRYARPPERPFSAATTRSGWVFNTPSSVLCRTLLCHCSTSCFPSSFRAWVTRHTWWASGTSAFATSAWLRPTAASTRTTACTMARQISTNTRARETDTICTTT